jgi:Ca2+-transporting ATPase
MVTGDGKETAVAIAAILGLNGDGKVVLSGAEVDRLSERELIEVAEKVCCYYRTNPSHKLRVSILSNFYQETLAEGEDLVQLTSSER